MLIRQYNTLWAFAILAAIVVGCQTGVRTEAVVDNISPILDRHDAYVETLLVDQWHERNMARHDARIVRSAIISNRDGYVPDYISVFVVLVLDRHDAWVRADETLPPLHRDVYLDSSAAVRLLFPPPVSPAHTDTKGE